MCYKRAFGPIVMCNIIFCRTINMLLMVMGCQRIECQNIGEERRVYIVLDCQGEDSLEYQWMPWPLPMTSTWS